MIKFSDMEEEVIYLNRYTGLRRIYKKSGDDILVRENYPECDSEWKLAYVSKKQNNYTPFKGYVFEGVRIKGPLDAFWHSTADTGHINAGLMGFLV